MDVLLEAAGIIGLLIVGIAIIFYTVDQKYPKIKIEVFDRGNRNVKNYRTVGFSIVKDNIMKLMMSEYEYCGDTRLLEKYLTPAYYPLLPIMKGLAPIYVAYNRVDYLCTIRKNIIDAEGNPMLIFEPTPTEDLDIEAIYDEKDKKTMGHVTLSKDGLLMPFKVHLSNDRLDEKEISNGKSIAARYIEAQKSSEKYLNATNPIMAVLISSIPMLLMVVSFGLILYLAIGQLGNSAEKILEASEKIVTALAAMK